VPAVKVKLSTRCKPTPQHYQGLAPLKPYEEFMVDLPTVRRIVFDPQANWPPNGQAWCHAHKRGAVIELPPHIAMDAKIKTDSPYGSCILQGDYGDAVLNYRLKAEGHLTVSENSGRLGSNRLNVELNFTYDCYMGGPPL